jgi:hypothetical protein
MATAPSPRLPSRLARDTGEIRMKPERLAPQPTSKLGWLARKDVIDIAAGRRSQNLDRSADCRSRGLRIFNTYRVSRGSKLRLLVSKPKCDALGSNSCNIPSCLPISSPLKEVIPVTLPPGRLRLATKPC